MTDRTGGPLTGLNTYIVFRSEDTPNTPVEIATLPASRTRYIDPDLDEAKQYFYSVLAVDGSDNRSVRAEAPGVTTSGVPVPLGLAAVSDIGQISLSWNASTRPGCGWLQCLPLDPFGCRFCPVCPATAAAPSLPAGPRISIRIWPMGDCFSIKSAP